MLQYISGIDSETGKNVAAIGKEYIDLRDINSIELREELDALYGDYARKLILDDSKRPRKQRYLPKQNWFRLFTEKVTHKKFDQADFFDRYLNLLEKYSGCTNQETLYNSAEFFVKNVFSENLKNVVLSNIANGTAIEILDKTNDEYINLKNQIACELYEEADSSVPRLNDIYQDIGQIYSDVSAQLVAYATDFRGLSTEEIENKIKDVNRQSLSEEKAIYIGENGYRNVNVGLSVKDDGVKLLDFEHVSAAMHNLAEEIKTLVNTPKDELSDEQYLKKASNLMYRFIRIHPFPDSNGRTSRALINMMTLNRDILVNFPKERKNEYTQAMEKSHKRTGYREENGYLESLYNNTQKANELEEAGGEEIYSFVLRNSRKVEENTNNEKENDEPIKNMEQDDARF